MCVCVYVYICIYDLSELCANYFSSRNNTSLVQLQIITGFCSDAAFELRGTKEAETTSFDGRTAGMI